MDCCVSWFKPWRGKYFSFLQAGKDGWRILKNNFWLFLTIFIALKLVGRFLSYSILSKKLVGIVKQADGINIKALFAVGIIVLSLFIIETFISLGILKFALREYNNEKTKISDLIVSWRSLWTAIKISLFVLILCFFLGLVWGGPILFIAHLSGASGGLKRAIMVLIMSLIWITVYLRYGFARYAVVDKQLNFSEATKFSSHVTYGARWKLCWTSGFLLVLIWLAVAILIIPIDLTAFLTLPYFCSESVVEAIRNGLLSHYHNFLNYIFAEFSGFLVLLYVPIYKQLEKLS